MRDLCSRTWVPVLAGLLGLMVLVGFSSPAVAVNVDQCIAYSGDTRFDLVQNLFCPGNGPSFPANSVVYLNGFRVVGPGIDSSTTGISTGGDSFIWGPGLVKGFGVCISGGNHTAVENLITNLCNTGISLGRSYKVKEVRVHDCHPSSLAGVGIRLGQGGFVESSIIRACDFGLITGQNNKIWNLIVTRHLNTGVSVGAGNAVSRTVISHPRSVATVGLDYTSCGGAAAGCEDASNSVSGHTGKLNIVHGTATVVTQSTEVDTLSATNCNGANVVRTVTGLFDAGDC